jgi:hypothetical protein
MWQCAGLGRCPASGPLAAPGPWDTAACSQPGLALRLPSSQPRTACPPPPLTAHDEHALGVGVVQQRGVHQQLVVHLAGGAGQHGKSAAQYRTCASGSHACRAKKAGSQRAHAWRFPCKRRSPGQKERLCACRPWHREACCSAHPLVGFCALHLAVQQQHLAEQGSHDAPNCEDRYGLATTGPTYPPPRQHCARKS